MTMTTLQVRVASKRTEAIDICTFELESMDGSALPPFSAGSHIDVHVSAHLIRQYSLCNDPRQTRRYQIAVLKASASRGGSLAMHDAVQVGSTLEISAPRNYFRLAHDATHSLLLAGGIGVTPILCMAHRLSTIGSKFEMHYCARSRERTAFHALVSEAAFAPQVQFHFDDEGSEQQLNLGQLFRDARAQSHVYVCGPKGFMDAVLKTARDAGWPESQLHYEFFSTDRPEPANEEGFAVQVASTGRIISVGRDETVIQALLNAGIRVPVSCEQGICGTCLTRVLEGEPDHRDLFLTLAEQARNNQFTPCCSRSKSPLLILDL